MTIKIEVRGIEQLNAFLRDLPRGAVKIGLPALAEWIVGNGQRGLKRYSPYKHVAYRSAYGGFKSEKQRRYVMAAIKDGRIDPGVPHRTGRTQRGYEVHITNGGYTAKITNDEPGAYWTRHDTGQARLNAMAGWRKMSDVVRTNIAGAVRHAQAKVNAWLKSK